MNRYTILFTVLSLCIMSATQAQLQPEHHSDVRKGAGTLMIVVTSIEINDKILKLNFEVINDSKREVWICDDVNVYRWIHSELYLADDDQTLMIRRRLDVPSIREWFRQPHGKYIRLRPGKKRYESLSITVPVEGHSTVFATGRSTPVPKDLDYATHLAIEIGYYEGDLPVKIFKMLEEVEKIYEKYPASRLPLLTFFFRGVLDFNSSSEESRQRDEEVVIPYTYQKFKGEKVLRASMDGLHIPYEEKRLLPPSPSGPDLTLCTKVEIRYQPSILEYFFPFESNQSLLSREEIEYLQSEETIVVEDQEALRAFATEIKKGVPFHGIVREVSMAHVDCYHDNDRQTSFTIYDNIIVETEEKKRLRYQRGLLSIRMLTSEIRQLEYRVQCAANLRNLWYSLRLYNILEGKRRKDSSIKSETIYPTPTEWCDATSRPATYVVSGLTYKRQGEHICPSAGEGKSHYAMNPNCKPDSPADRVLLFETKAGWNQHGGPELFTFDNHDPRGGCVLLNDGTVKFIRTKEELQQLRWK